MTALVVWLRADPRRAFALDGAGALVSALVLGLALPPFEHALGASRPALLSLAAVPVVFAFYDLACWAARPRRWRAAMRAIAIANLTYPVLSAATLWGDGVALTGLGATYFVLESAVLWAIAALELFVAKPEAA